MPKFEPVTITLEMKLGEAEAFRDAVADVICWCKGFNAGKPEHIDGPQSVEVVTELNIRLRAAISKVVNS